MSKSISLEELNKMLNDGLNVFEHYYMEATGRNLSLTTKMISPFKRNGKFEEDPSFSVYPHRSKNTYFFMDHGLDKSGTHWQFVMDLFGLDFKDAVAKVKSDLLSMHESGKSFIKAMPTLNFVRTIRKNTRSEINPVFRDWNEKDLRLYKEKGISAKTLDIFHANALSHFEVKKENKTFQIICKESSPGYCYSFPSGHYKICQPFADPKYKWTSNLSAEMDVFGFELIPKECEHLFIIGGNTDTMSFYENIGHPVMALSSESSNISDELLSILHRIAKNIWILYDNDPQGYRKAAKFFDEYGFRSLNHLYKPFEVKDFCKLYQRGGSSIHDFNLALNENINL